MKEDIVWIPLAIICFFTGCGTGSGEDWDKGYESAWEQESEPSRWASESQKEGYECGQADCEAWDDGYYAGINGRRPVYLDDDLYMEGFKEGKKDK